MKRWLKISVTLGILLALTGCGKANKQSVEPTTGKDSTTQVEEATDTVKEKIEDTTPQVDVPQGDQAEKVIIVLDPGHGGGFPGASYDGRVEKELTLNMANYVKEYLDDNYTGMDVILDRDTDSALSGDVSEDLELRAQLAKDANADVLISLHFNASEDHDQQGSMVLVSHQEHVTEGSKELGSLILKELESLGIENNGNVTKNSNDMFDDEGKPLDYYAINRHCAARDIPGIIVEHCYIDNANDINYIDSEEDLRTLAKADAVGIANYFGLATK